MGIYREWLVDMALPGLTKIECSLQRTSASPDQTTSTSAGPLSFSGHPGWGSLSCESTPKGGLWTPDRIGASSLTIAGSTYILSTDAN